MAVVDLSGQIAALQVAIATGARSVSYDGKSVSYGSLEEMIRAVAYLQRVQARANGMPRPVASKAAFSRGYYQRGLGSGLIFQRTDEDL